MSVLPSALPSAVKVPLKIAKVVPLPKAYKLVTKSLFALSWESSSSSCGSASGPRPWLRQPTLLQAMNRRQ